VYGSRLEMEIVLFVILSACIYVYREVEMSFQKTRRQSPHFLKNGPAEVKASQVMDIYKSTLFTTKN
jgi:hypothetical protein